jgi:hypothetical protein
VDHGSVKGSFCSGVASALSVRSGALSLDIECGIPSTDCWPDFQVEEAVSTLKSKEKSHITALYPQAWLGRYQRVVQACQEL